MKATSTSSRRGLDGKSAPRVVGKEVGNRLKVI